MNRRSLAPVRLQRADRRPDVFVRYGETTGNTHVRVPPHRNTIYRIWIYSIRVSSQGTGNFVMGFTAYRHGTYEMTNFWRRLLELVVVARAGAQKAALRVRVRLLLARKFTHHTEVFRITSERELDAYTVNGPDATICRAGADSFVPVVFARCTGVNRASTARPKPEPRQMTPAAGAFEPQNVTCVTPFRTHRHAAAQERGHYRRSTCAAHPGPALAPRASHLSTRRRRPFLRRHRGRWRR